jgi:uncharacterized protein (TIGR02444 family)
MVRLVDIRQQKMNEQNDVEAASAGLWDFSLAFYDRPDVAAALLTLQDGAGVDVILVLFAMWLGLSGRGRLDAPRIEAAERAAGTVRREVVEPLRALRCRLKTIIDNDVQRLRDSVKRIEIEAERVALSRMAAVAGPVSQADPVTCLTDTEANLRFVLASTKSSARPAAIIRRELRRFARNVSPGPRSSRPPRPTV